jgi:hypothetical protein
MDNTGLIEEYKSLREEILKRQDTRTTILGFTVTAIGTVIGLSLQGSIPQSRDIDYFAFALISFALLLIIAALLLTIQHTQQIDTIAGYIKKFIEPNAGIHWESYYGRYRNLKRSNPKTGGTPLGTSKPLALYYGALSIAVYTVGFGVGLNHHLLPLILISVLAMGSLSCSYDLYSRKTRGWRINWEAMDKPDS